MINYLKDHFDGDCQHSSNSSVELLNFTLDVICSFDSSGKFLFVTAAAKNVLGYDPSELLGKKYADLVHPEDNVKTEAAVAVLLEGKKLTNFENRYIRKDGTIVPLLWSASFDKEKNIIHGVAKDATQLVEERSKAETYKQRLFRAYNLSKIAWWEWNASGETFVASDELYDIYGINKKNYPVLSTDVYLSMVHPDDLEKVRDAIFLSQQLEFNEYEHRMIKPSGEIIHVIHFVQSIRDANKNVVQVHGSTRDITKRKKAELELKKSRRTLKTILDSIGDGFFAVDKDWTVTYWNPKAEELLFTKRSDILGKNLWQVFQDAVSLKFYSEYHRAFRDNTPVHFEEYFHPLQIWIEVSAYPSKETLAVYFRDITDRKRQDLTLKESNERYEHIAKATFDAIWDYDLLSKTFFCNDGFNEMFGFGTRQVSSEIEFWKTNIHPDDLNRVLNFYQNLMISKDTTWFQEFRFLKRTGEYALVQDKGVVIRNENDQAIRLIGALRDITIQREAELSLQLSENRFRLLFDQSPRPKWMFKEKSLQIVEVNNAALQLYGYTKEEFLQLTIFDLKYPPDREQLYQLQEQKLDFFQGTVRHIKKSGQEFFIDINTHYLDLPSGRHFIVSGEDITEKLELQQRLIEEKVKAQKRIGEAVLNAQEKERSEMGRELHDNVNQILTSVKLYQELVLSGTGNQEFLIKKSIELLLEAINANRTLSKQLSAPTLGNIKLKESVVELLETITATHQFEVRLELDAIDELEIEQETHLAIYRILQEHLTNILKYAKASRVEVHFDFVDDDLVLKISDNGIGFDTQKRRSGIGISNMTMRAESLGGTLVVNSSPGLGCVLIVRIPHI